MRQTGHVEHMGKMRNEYTILVGIYPKETVCEGVDWIYLAQSKSLWHVLLNTISFLVYKKREID
jgi:hypothetical protein